MYLAKSCTTFCALISIAGHCKFALSVTFLTFSLSSLKQSNQNLKEIFFYLLIPYLWIIYWYHIYKLSIDTIFMNYLLIPYLWIIYWYHIYELSIDTIFMNYLLTPYLWIIYWYHIYELSIDTIFMNYLLIPYLWIFQPNFNTFWDNFG